MYQNLPRKLVLQKILVKDNLLKQKLLIGLQSRNRGKKTPASGVYVITPHCSVIENPDFISTYEPDLCN